MAYCHMTSDTDCVADNMTRQTLEAELLSTSGMGKCPRMP